MTGLFFPIAADTHASRNTTADAYDTLLSFQPVAALHYGTPLFLASSHTCF